MSEYLKQAQDFLKKYNATITFDLEGKHNIKCKKKYFHDDKAQRNIYNVTIKRIIEGEKYLYKFIFGDSLYNTENGLKPNEYDVLACLAKYEVEDTAERFAYEFGYDYEEPEDKRKVNKIHKAAQKEYENVIIIFGDCIEELREIQ